MTLANVNTSFEAHVLNSAPPLIPSSAYAGAKLNSALVDVAFAGDPVQCEPSACKRLKETYAFFPVMSQNEEKNLRYIFDVDGNGWSGRFKRLITGRRVVLKATLYKEWYVYCFEAMQADGRCGV